MTKLISRLVQAALEAEQSGVPRDEIEAAFNSVRDEVHSRRETAEWHKRQQELAVAKSILAIN